MSEIDEAAETAIRAAAQDMIARNEPVTLDELIVEARRKLAQQVTESSMEIRNRVLEAGQAMEARGELVVDDETVTLT